MDVLLNNETTIRKRKQIRTAPKDKKKELTPNQIAINKLDSIIIKKIKGGGDAVDFPTVPPEDYERYRKVLVNSNQLPHMNIPVLARVLLWLSNYNNELSIDAYKNLNEDPDEYFAAIIDKHINPSSTRVKDEQAANKFTENDIEIINLRMMFTFKRYGDLIINLLEQQELETEQFEEENIEFEEEGRELVNPRHEQDIYYDQQ